MIIQKELKVSDSHFKFELAGRYSVFSGDLFIIFSNFTFVNPSHFLIDNLLVTTFSASDVSLIFSFYHDCLFEIEKYHENLELNLKQA